jgi:hypothetical protein
MTQDLSKIEKLPKWAQGHITNLTRKVNELTDHVREISEPESILKTDTVVHYFTQPDVKLPLGSSIEFLVGGDRVQVRVRDEQLQIMSINGRLLIEPQVSNVVNVRTHR